MPFNRDQGFRILMRAPAFASGFFRFRSHHAQSHAQRLGFDDVLRQYVGDTDIGAEFADQEFIDLYDELTDELMLMSSFIVSPSLLCTICIALLMCLFPLGVSFLLL